MMIIFSHDRLHLGSDQADTKGDRKDQSVECTCDNQKSCRISKNNHDCCGNHDERDDDCILILLNRFAEGL